MANFNIYTKQPQIGSFEIYKNMLHNTVDKYLRKQDSSQGYFLIFEYFCN